MSDDQLVDLDFDHVTLTEQNCVSCGIRFALPKHLEDTRRRDHAIFYCPNGHGQSWTAPKKERDEEMEDLREAMRQAQADRRAALDDLAAERAAHEQTKASKPPLFRRRR